MHGLELTVLLLAVTMVLQPSSAVGCLADRPEAVSLIHTCPSCPALAMVDRISPSPGAQAQSRTQSVWPPSTSSCSQTPLSAQRHTCVDTRITAADCPCYACQHHSSTPISSACGEELHADPF